MKIFRRILHALSHIVSPDVCQVCGTTLVEGEEVMCAKCLIDMPRTNLSDLTFNEIHRRVGRLAPVEKAISWFYYTKDSSYARLLIDAKYGNHPRQDFLLGRLFAQELLPTGFFADIEALVPVPMHWRKRLLRGYNQTEEICLGISEATGLPLLPILRAPYSHGVQSRHSFEQRLEAISGTFDVSDKAGSNDGKHLLIVDDIITSGATMTEAVTTIHAALPASPLSLLSLSMTI